jgi:5-methylcytosine-specific restriction enzyme A
MGVRLHELQARLSPRFERFPHIRPWPFRRFEPKQPVVYAWAAWCSASLHDTRPPGLHAVLQEPCASCHRTVGRRHCSRPFHRTGEVDVTTRPCLGCGQLIASGSRCPQCKRPYTSAGRTRRARVVAEWINIYGAWCPGWQRPAHPSTDLTADHQIAVAAGGPEDGPLRVLCRGCNSARGANL